MPKAKYGPRARVPKSKRSARVAALLAAEKAAAVPQRRIRSIVRQEVNKTREIKRLWGQIKVDNNANILTVPKGTLIPAFVYSDDPAYSTTCLNLTKQGLENENRIGNSIQPLRFTLKGYGIISDMTNSNTVFGESHVRVVCGFRRQKSLLVKEAGNLMMQGGVEVPLTNLYQDILTSFNWKEFKPFYDRTFKVCPMTRDSNVPITNPFTKNYFHFNIDHKFRKNDKLQANEEADGTTANLYNNKNIYVMIMCRQMNNDGDDSNLTCEVFGTTQFAFHDA